MTIGLSKKDVHTGKTSLMRETNQESGVATLPFLLLYPEEDQRRIYSQGVAPGYV